MRTRRHAAGFTLIELVTVMILIGIMAFVAIPRFGDRTFAEKAFRDEIAAAVQHGRRMAVASRRFTCVNVDANAGIVALRRDTAPPEAAAAVACAGTAGDALPLPAQGSCTAANEVCAPNGVALGGSSLIFDPLGRLVTTAKAVQGAALAITVSNQSGITVQPETGYVQ